MSLMAISAAIVAYGVVLPPSSSAARSAIPTHADEELYQ